MKDYSLTGKEAEKFILYFNETEEELIIHYASGEVEIRKNTSKNRRKGRGKNFSGKMGRIQTTKGKGGLYIPKKMENHARKRGTKQQIKFLFFFCSFSFEKFDFTSDLVYIYYDSRCCEWEN